MSNDIPDHLKGAFIVDNQTTFSSGSSDCYSASRPMQTGPVALNCITPEARDLLEEILTAYAGQYKPEMHRCSPDDVYQFAYWLVRWSGLIQPAEKTELDKPIERRKCPQCHGAGLCDIAFSACEDRQETCSYCDGDGYVVESE